MALLSSCAREVTKSQALEFEICPEALALADPQRAFQGFDGWFFFQHDFRETYETMAPEQVAFAAQLNSIFAKQGILLVLVPIPNRGAVRPEVLYPADPKQAAFSPATLKANFDAYIESLERQGVATVNVLAEATAFDKGGGQTFFKRDLHWTFEGANMIAKVVAAKIHERLKEPLPVNSSTLTRNPNDQIHFGVFMNRWLHSACGYAFPPEPLGDYTVTQSSGSAQPSESAQPAEVVQLGSSHSLTPFDQGFLSVALQSNVTNLAVGNGGVFFSLENYLASDDYLRARPKVLVWEFPASAAPVDPRAQRRLFAATYGICSGATTQFEQTVPAADSVLKMDGNLGTTSSHLTFSFSDLYLLHFKATLRYSSGREETLAFDRPDQIAEQNRGRFFTTLMEDAGSLEEISLQASPKKTGTVKVQLCQTS